MSESTDKQDALQRTWMAAIQALHGLSANEAPSQDVGQSQNVPDPAAQQGVSSGPNDSVDYDKIRQLFQDIHSGTPMQEGDKVHPQDAMQQIGSQMYQSPAGPTAPAGFSNATGLQLKTDKKGQLTYSAPSSIPLLRLLGVHTNEPLNAPNFFQSAQQAGITKYLGTGLARMPDGTPFVGKTVYEQALQTFKDIQGQGNQVYTNKAQLLAQGVPEDTASALMAANPNGVSNKEVTNYLSTERNKTANILAQSKATMAGVSVIAQKIKLGGFDAAQPLVEGSLKNIGLANRAQAAIDQIVSSGGMANQAQRAELASSMGSLVGQNAGVLTDERMKQFLPDSAKAKFGNTLAYWTNENQPVDFTGFLPQLQDLLTREKQANQGMVSAGQQFGINVLAQSQPETAKFLTNNIKANPLMGGTPPAAPVAPQGQPMTPPASPALQNPMLTSYIQKNRIKDTPANRAWAAKKLGMTQ